MKLVLQPVIGNEHPTLPPYKFEKVLGDRKELYDAIVGAMQFGISKTGIGTDLMYRMITGYIVRGEDKRVIGTCVFANDGGEPHVCYLWVAEPYRRQHIGENLVNLAILRANQNGYYKLCARVWDDRTSAIELFKKLGFKEEK